jgi:hypothetical protein
MRVWARAGAAVLAAAVAGVLSGAVLDLTLPSPSTRPPPGPVLESVAPAQLMAMGLRLDPTLQPAELPDWLSNLGARLPSGVVQARDAEAAVRASTAGVRSVTERVLTYATITGRNARMQAPTVAGRLVWAVVGTHAAGLGGLQQALWLVDARTGHELLELPVPPPSPGLPPPVAAGP